MPMWLSLPTPWSARWWASRFERSSSSRYVMRRSPDTRHSRSGAASATSSNRSAMFHVFRVVLLGSDGVSIAPHRERHEHKKDPDDPQQGQPQVVQHGPYLGQGTDGVHRMGD